MNTSVKEKKSNRYESEIHVFNDLEALSYRAAGTLR